jgi:hypothetical protein
VNCEQARSILSASRELKDGTFDSTELDVHLEGCASCRQTLARDMFIGERLRALPTLEPPPEMHERVMRALAHEHAQFLQKASPGSVPTPEFLKPYLQEHARVTQISNHFSALSTAETGPLPIIHAKRRSRSRPHMSHFAVLGLAAMFLMVLMMGGITSLLILAHDNTTPLTGISSSNSAALDYTAIQKGTFATSTPYQHVASAVANLDSIYYTAYQDDIQTAWMLLQLDRTSKKSTPLLAQPTDQPIIVLGSNPQWLVWLQFEKPIARPHNTVPNTSLLPWSLRILPLAQVAQSPVPIPPTTLLNGKFDQSTVPGWVQTPIQGIWLAQNVLLVATIDSKGVSHLLEYQLDLTGKPTLTEIAKANPGHILASPTANSDASEIYWADEWMSDAGILNSNILTQQEFTLPGPVHSYHKRWVSDRMQTIQQGVFRNDGMSFRPQIADGKLFWLSTATLSNSASKGTPPASQTPLVATPQISSTLTPRIEPDIYAPQMDTTILGQIFMQPLDGLKPPVSLNNSGAAYALQVGTDFALWQNDKGYEMYDVPTQNNVPTGTTLNDAALLAVNGDSAVWVANTSPNAATSTQGQDTLTPVRFYAFNWPK